MRIFIASLIFVTILIGCKSNRTDSANDISKIRIPGEFEPQNAIWLGYRSIESSAYNDNDTISLKIIKTLNPYTKLNLVVEHDSLFKEGMDYFADMGLDTSKINIFYQSPTDVWYRDPGPIFGITPDNKLAIADFKYTAYANVPPDSIDNYAIDQESIDCNVAERLNIPTVISDVAIEGGAFETNGKGTLIQVESVTLKRNPHLSKVQIEEDFCKNFGICNVIWLPSGVADDPHNFKRIHGDIFGFGTGGHTDEFVRFANDSVILLSWISKKEKDLHPINKLNYELLSKNLEILKNSVDQNGHSFTIIKVPHPTARTYEELIDSSWFKNDYSKEYIDKYGFKLNDTIIMAYSSSYLNYIISDSVIILPEYWTRSKPLSVKEKDHKVSLIFKELYPDRKILGINPISLNEGGGGMHCRYQSEPKVK